MKLNVTVLLILSLIAMLHLSMAAAKPNILIVLCDDLGYSDLGCYGGEIPTPNIDLLAKHGIRFTHMANSARCCPSRASLLTGLHPAQAGIPNMDGHLNDHCVTIAEVLRAAGYKTYATGKWHVGNTPDSGPLARGFDEFYGFPAGHSQDQWDPNAYRRLPRGRTPEFTHEPGKFYATDVFTDYAVEFIRQGQASQKPWLLYLAYSSPHFPIQAPAESARPFLATYRRGWDVLRAERFQRQKEIGLVDHDGWKLTDRSIVPVEQNNDIANGYSGQPNPAWDSLPPARREDLARRMAIFAAMIKHIDDGVGRIVGQLKSDGSFDNTLILLLSDNGACYEWGPFGFDGISRGGLNILHEGAALDAMGGPGTHMSYGSAWANLCDTPFRLYKHFTHEGGIITPFIVHWPQGVRDTDRWIRDPAHIMDIMSTLMEVGGATYPQQRKGVAVLPPEGISLVPTFCSREASLPERSLCFQHEGARAIRKGQWKLVMGKRFPKEAQWELYDIKADPCETLDLAARHPEVVTALSKEWDAWAKRTGSFARREKPTPHEQAQMIGD
jgi:arylsulfatase